MQTPAGYEIVQSTSGTKAVLTDFLAAAFNPSMLPRYAHVIVAVLMVGGFTAVAISAYYLRRGTHTDFARKTMKTGIAVAAIFTVLMLPAGHWQAVNVVDNQPSKIAAFEGHWEDGPIPLGLVGWVNPGSGKTTALEIPGGVNLLAGDFSRTKSYPGLNSFAPEDRPPLQLSYQTYHWMVMLWGAMLLLAGITWWLNRRGSLEKQRWFLGLLMFAPLLPMLAIQLGWAAAEVGRQPWIVWGELRTVDAISKAVPAAEVATTLALFVLFYTVIYVAWARVVVGFIRKGPEEHKPGAGTGVREPVPVGSGAPAASATAFSTTEGVE